MELTEKTFTERIKKIIELKKAGGDAWNELCNRLKEKGTEYCLVFPLFEIVLGYNPLTDVKIEPPSDKSYQIFDLVIMSKEDEYSLIVEVKSMSETNLDKDKSKYEKQLSSYMEKNPNYPWGILTNGLEWHFYVSKKYIEKKFNEGNLIIPLKDKVLKIFSLNLDDEYFLKIMKEMEKGNLSGFWMRCSEFAYRVIDGKIQLQKIIDHKEANTYLKEKIKDYVEIHHGEYWDAIKCGIMSEGKQIICQNDFIKLTFTLDTGGRLLLSPENTKILDLQKFMENCEGHKLLFDWLSSVTPFTDRAQIVLALTNRQKYMQSLKDMFPFNPPPPDITDKKSKDTSFGEINKDK